MVVTTGDKKRPILASSEYGPGMLTEFPKVHRTQDAYLHPRHCCLIQKYPALLPRESRLRDSALDKKKDSSGVNRKKTAGNEDGSECAHDPLG